MKATHAFSRGFECPIETRFEHQHCAYLSRSRLDERARMYALDFFVGVEQKPYRGRLFQHYPKCLNSPQSLNETGFHVKHTRASCNVSIITIRTLGEGTNWPNSIEVAEYQHARHVVLSDQDVQVRTILLVNRTDRTAGKFACSIRDECRTAFKSMRIVRR